MTPDLQVALDALAAVASGERAAPGALEALRRYGAAQGPPFEPEERDGVRAALERVLAAPCGGAALRAARDTGALGRLLPELGDAVGFDQRTRHHALDVDEHIISAVEAAAELDAPLRVRLALLFHDAGKPEAAWEGVDGRLHYYANPQLGKDDHAGIGARLARSALGRLGYPPSEVEAIAALVEHHMLWPSGRRGQVRRLRERLGDELLAQLFEHRRADTLAKRELDGGARRLLREIDEMEREARALRDGPG